MNPLDSEEFPVIMRDLQKEMPQIDENRVGVKRSFSQGMPKNLMDYCAVVDNKYLNNNLAIIEEIQYRDSKHPIPKWFRLYQKHNFEKYGILNHDNFFNARLNDGWRKHLSPNLTEIREVGFFQYANMTTFSNPQLNRTTQVNGTEIETDGATDNAGNNSADFLEAGTSSSFTNGAYYDQMKFYIGAAAGNLRLALYSDSVTSPNTLLSESASLTPSADYTTNYSITEVQINATTAWLAHNQSSSGLTWHYWSSSGNRGWKTQAFGAMPASFTEDGTSTTTIPRLKVLHS